MNMRKMMTLLESAPRPKASDIRDAITHADYNEEGWTPADFNKEYLGYMTVDEISGYDDIEGWLEVDTVDDLPSYRDGSFPKEVKEMPPVILITAPDEGEMRTQIGDGRGRINYAVAHDIKLHVWHLTYKDNSQ
jgi:hypothetical protein